MMIYLDYLWQNGPEAPFETLEEAQADRIAVIDFAAKSMRDKVVSGISAGEMASWPIKLAEANAGGGPMLTIEAQARGITVDALIARILGNAVGFSQLEATIAGNSGRHEDAIRAMTKIDEVVAYDMRDGWPEV